MTLSIRAPATLLSADAQTPLAGGIAVIWADPQGWGGVFEAQGPAEALREAAAAAPLSALLRTGDGRLATITLSLSEFVADAARPLTFRGEGPIDTAAFRAFSDALGRSQL
ncbi:MAG: hypothetical protein HGA45_31210 [Chloroflexales bacterium]|nr:hypothetical protein [Chloroflexales bacterium]